MSFPQTFAEAKANFKPLKRNRIKRKRPIGKKSRRRKKLTDGQLKKKVWKQFSIHIRVSAADGQGYVQCVTCPARHLWDSGEIHAGHWIHNRLDYDERNVHPQCVRCNYHWNTKVSISYSIFMARTYGIEVMEELQLLANTQGNRYPRAELEALLEKYRSLNAANPLLKL